MDHGVVSIRATLCCRARYWLYGAVFVCPYVCLSEADIASQRLKESNCFWRTGGHKIFLILAHNR